ncbi:MAG: AsmA family protein, partial [Acidobacteriaceae bacterium]
MDALEELQPSDELYEARRPPWRALIIVAAVIVLLVLAIFLPPLINLGKYKRSLTASMSEALGRPVYVGGMQLRLLPMPGIVMSDFTVDEDPAFGYEPALHASSVVASLRFSSLWRGRLEVSRI